MSARRPTAAVLEASGTCYVCGSPELVEDADPRNPVCDRHLPSRLHVISMTRDGPLSVATCACGWSARRPAGDWIVLDALIRTHWRVACGENLPCAA